MNFENDVDYNNLINGEYGNAKLFFKEKVGSIVVTSNKGDGYLYNETRCLWEERTASFIRSEMPGFLQIKINYYLLLATSQLSMATTEQLKTKYQSIITQLNKLSKTVTKTSYAKSVYEPACQWLKDADFLGKINSISNLLPIKDGKVIDLSTRTTRQRTKEDFFTFELDVEFKDEMESFPNAKKFFSELMNGDEECTKYIQKIMGYALTGETSSRCLFLFWGAGSNGKSSLTDIMDKILKKFSICTSKDIFIKQDRSSTGATPHYIPLIGARMATFSESEKNEKLNASVIKTLTGDDTISCRALYGDQFQFKPICKLFMLTNHKPEFDGNDTAIIDRLKYVPFNARFTPNPKEGEFKKDPSFIKKLVECHLDEIFTWICHGAYEWYQDKEFNPPEVIKQATTNYLNEMDIVSNFINDCCIVGPKQKVKRSLLHEQFVEYIKEQGKYMQKKVFFEQLEKQGFKLVKTHGLMTYSGIGLKSDESDDEENAEPSELDK